MKTALHNLTHDVKFSANQGEIIPVCCFDVLPGDKIDHTVSALIRLQPQLAPIMHEVDVKFHTWFVPNRLIWTEWEDFYTGGPDGLNASIPPYMTFPTGGYAIGSLADYLGLPTGDTVDTLTHSALPIRAYNLIYNNWYRDQQLQPEKTISLASGSDTTTSKDLLNACWERDYLTSARPQPQLGPDVVLPLAGQANVVRQSNGISGQWFKTGTNVASGSSGTTGIGSGGAAGKLINLASESLSYDPLGSLKADMSTVSGIDVNDLRELSAVQRYMENLNNYGARYIERIMQAFGVRPQDSRLQLPEYLGGGQQKIQFSEVLQTAEGTDPVGEMRGHGIAALRSNRYRRFIPEHGWIITVMIVRPKTQYIQNLARMWSRDTKYDYFQPELQNLGDQAVLNKEVYAAHTQPNSTFGFQNMFEEYRGLESRVAGEFRDTLDFWHMARKFTSDPALNSTFVTANPTDRIYAVPSADQMYVTLKNKIMARRRVSKTSKPMLF